MIKSPNYTQIPNDYLDTIMQTLSGAENLVILTIMRKTFGWQKKRDRISYRQIAELSGIGSYTTIKKALVSLTEKGLIAASNDGKFISYEINIENATETVKDKTSNDYSNCSDTITESVVIMPKIATETVDTKESNSKKTNKEIYEEIETCYINAYKEVMGNEPTLIFGKIRGRLKTLLTSIPKDKILHAITQAKKDAWVIKEGFQFMIILSDNVLNRLINTGVEKVYKPVQKTEARLCPHCHIPLKGSACPQCYANFDMNGKEM